MFAILFSTLILFAGQKGGFMEFYDKYLNYPGFEFWKFLNLAIFVAVLVHLLRKPLSEKFKQKRDEIRAEIIRAAREKEEAMSRLTAAEARLAGLANEKESIIREAKAEAEAEVARLMASAEEEAGRLKSQSEIELMRLYQQAKSELRRFTAEESIRRAETKLKQRITPEIDNELVQSGVKAIGGMN
jgi:F-type H+-transporting ATPase subunit b